jgi:hypothetical protein
MFNSFPILLVAVWAFFLTAGVRGENWRQCTGAGSSPSPSSSSSSPIDMGLAEVTRATYPWGLRLGGSYDISVGFLLPQTRVSKGDRVDIDQSGIRGDHWGAVADMTSKATLRILSKGMWKDFAIPHACTSCDLRGENCTVTAVMWLRDNVNVDLGTSISTMLQLSVSVQWKGGAHFTVCTFLSVLVLPPVVTLGGTSCFSCNSTVTQKCWAEVAGDADGSGRVKAPCVPGHADPGNVTRLSSAGATCVRWPKVTTARHRAAVPRVVGSAPRGLSSSVTGSMEGGVGGTRVIPRHVVPAARSGDGHYRDREAAVGEAVQVGTGFGDEKEAVLVEPWLKETAAAASAPEQHDVHAVPRQLHDHPVPIPGVDAPGGPNVAPPAGDETGNDAPLNRCRCHDNDTVCETVLRSAGRLGKRYPPPLRTCSIRQHLKACASVEGVGAGTHVSSDATGTLHAVASVRGDVFLISGWATAMIPVSVLHADAGVTDHGVRFIRTWTRICGVPRAGGLDPEKDSAQDAILIVATVDSTADATVRLVFYRIGTSPDRRSQRPSAVRMGAWNLKELDIHTLITLRTTIDDGMCTIALAAPLQGEKGVIYVVDLEPKHLESFPASLPMESSSIIKGTDAELFPGGTDGEKSNSPWLRCQRTFLRDNIRPQLEIWGWELAVAAKGTVLLVTSPFPVGRAVLLRRMRDDATTGYGPWKRFADFGNMSRPGSAFGFSAEMSREGSRVAIGAPQANGWNGAAVHCFLGFGQTPTMSFYCNTFLLPNSSAPGAQLGARIDVPGDLSQGCGVDVGSVATLPAGTQLQVQTVRNDGYYPRITFAATAPMAHPNFTADVVSDAVCLEEGAVARALACMYIPLARAFDLTDSYSYTSPYRRTPRSFVLMIIHTEIWDPRGRMVFCCVLRHGGSHESEKILPSNKGHARRWVWQ